MSDDHGERRWWGELTFRDGVRKRPAMYVGDIGLRGLHLLVGDILTDSLLSGAAHSIAVALGRDSSVGISIDGRGFPRRLEDCLTEPRTPDFRKFRPDQNDDVFRIWAFAVANALSERFHIEAAVDGKVFAQKY